MIDTIKISQTFSNIHEVKKCINVLERLYHVKKTYSCEVDNPILSKESYTCWDNGFKIWIINNKLFIQGSLTKLYFGNNIQNLSGSELILAYEKLMSKYTFVNWEKAIHKRLDLGVNLFLSDSPSFVINKVIGMDRMKKSTYMSNGDSVIIGNKSQQIIFYNKSKLLEKECTNKGDIIPKNALRIEFKMMETYPLEKRFRTKMITVRHVLNHMDLLPKMWHEMYSKVKKDYSTNIGLFSTKNEMEMKAIIKYGIESILNDLNASYEAKKIKKSAKQNIQKYLSSILEYQKLNAGPSSLIVELDEKVQDFLHSNTFFPKGSYILS